MCSLHRTPGNTMERVAPRFCAKHVEIRVRCDNCESGERCTKFPAMKSGHISGKPRPTLTVSRGLAPPETLSPQESTLTRFGRKTTVIWPWNPLSRASNHTPWIGHETSHDARADFSKCSSRKRCFDKGWLVRMVGRVWNRLLGLLPVDRRSAHDIRDLPLIRPAPVVPPANCSSQSSTK